MDEIKTKIDLVFDFVQTKRKTTLRELSREVRVNADELDKYVNLLRKYGLIKVEYQWFNTFLYAEEIDLLKLSDEFKSQLYSSPDAETKGVEVTDKNLKITALRSMQVE